MAQLLTEWSLASILVEEPFAQHTLALYLLSRVYTDMGKQPEAEETERKAFDLAVQQNDLALIRTISAAHR